MNGPLVQLPGPIGHGSKYADPSAVVALEATGTSPDYPDGRVLVHVAGLAAPLEVLASRQAVTSALWPSRSGEPLGPS